MTNERSRIMHTLYHVDRNLDNPVLRMRSRAWSEMARAIEEAWKSSAAMDWSVKTEISIEEILADLAYGRD
jgi:hypothetical protein